MTLNNKFKNTILLISITSFISCYSQEKENNMDKKETAIIENYFSKYKFQNTEVVFEKVNKNLLGISSDNLEKGYNNVLIFNEPTDYQISKEGKFIKIGNDILPDLDSINIDHKNPYFEEVLTLNKIIYQDDLSSILNIISKNTDLALDLVTIFNYEKNEILLQSVIRSLKSIDELPQSHKLSLVFYNDVNSTNKIRENLLKKINKNDNLLYEISFFLADNHEKIVKVNGISPHTLEKAIAFLLNIGFEGKENIDIKTDKSYLLLNNIYFSHPELLELFKKKNYYDYNKLKQNSNTYELLRYDNQEKIYSIIHDPDGYTNLRKDKTTTSEVLQKIKSGEYVEVLDSVGDWYLIKTKEGKKGYVHKSRIKSE